MGGAKRYPSMAPHASADGCRFAPPILRLPEDNTQRDRPMAKVAIQPSSPILPADKSAALALTPVSRETEARLDRYISLLVEWQAKTNLDAASTLQHLWSRHVAVSHQILSPAPSARTCVD